MHNWYNSKNKVKNKRRTTRTRKGLRPSEMKNQYSGGGLVRGYHAEKIACKRQIQIQKTLINITVTDRFHTC